MLTVCLVYRSKAEILLVLWLMLMTLHWLRQVGQVYVPLINVCDKFSLDYDITFNDTNSQLMFFKCSFSNVSACGFHVNGQNV